MNKLMRQTSSLSGGQAQLNSANSPFGQNGNSQAVQKLVDIDDNPLSSPFNNDKSNSTPGSHLICNRNNKIQRGSNGGFPGANGLDRAAAGAKDLSFFIQSLEMNPHEVKVLIALYDYDPPKDSEDLSFQKGEHLETTDIFMHGDWWLARSKSSRKIGYVPSNYVAQLKTLGAEPWFLGKIGRAEAERRLKMPENEDGAFIIRTCDTAPNEFSLSIRDNNGCKHYKIKTFETGGYFISKKTVFSTLHDLVLHYSSNPDGLVINLRKPCVTAFDKPVPASLSHDTSDEYEIDRKDISLGRELGRGQFGQVYEGLFRGTKMVAVKTLRNGSMESQDFLAEAQIMKKMKHPNLVNLFAVCTKGEPIYIITELMSKGALIDYLHTEKGKSLPATEYINMATQIAAGMTYLEREKYVHRDLAARNILVGDRNVCKIADFGLARFIKENEYEARQGAKFPIKWTAPEAANHCKFTIKSDVWSYGIVLYEIITKGGTPYPDMSNAEVLSRIDKGYRMPMPPFCEDKYYSIMQQCWRREPQQRPTFEYLHYHFDHYFESDEQYREASQFLAVNR